ncbi:MAG: hypothetical protein GY711_33305 [bacterium]|nr:hypothetical protein [bacterium]
MRQRVVLLVSVAAVDRVRVRLLCREAQPDRALVGEDVQVVPAACRDVEQAQDRDRPCLLVRTVHDREGQRHLVCITLHSHTALCPAAPATGDAPTHRRLLGAMHALDHLDRWLDRMAEEERWSEVRADPALANDARAVRGNTARLLRQPSSGVSHSCAAFWSARTRPLLRCASSEPCSEVASSLRLAANAYAPTKMPHKSESHH